MTSGVVGWSETLMITVLGVAYGNACPSIRGVTEVGSIGAIVDDAFGRSEINTSARCGT